MKHDSYDDLDEQCDAQGCLQPVAVLLLGLGFFIWVMCGLTGCTVVRPCPEKTQREAAEYEYIVRELSR